MRKRGKRAAIIPPSGLQATLEAQTGHLALRNRAILYVSHYLALRAMEIAALKVGDVYDPATGDIRDVVNLTVTKGDVFREVPFMNETARAALRRYLQTRSKRPDSPLFLSQKGGGFSADTMQKLIKRMYVKSGVRGSSHSGRRTCATNLLNAGMDVIYLMHFLGHADIKTTQRYVETNVDRMKHFAAQLK